ncbi:MAG: hypothetical protein ACHQPI_11465 [Thermoanaerobaculia bacterium]
MNARYWAAMCRRYATRDLGLRLFLAASASGAVAGWSLWAQSRWLWKSISAIAALISIASPLLAYTRQSNVMASIAGEWTQLQVEYDLLWGQIDESFTSTEEKRFHELKKREVGNRKQETKLPVNKKLLEWSQKEVLVSHGLV